MKNNKEIVYLKHPVSAEQKTKVIKEGKRIIDIRFMPEELKAKASKPKPAPKKESK